MEKSEEEEANTSQVRVEVNSSTFEILTDLRTLDHSVEFLAREITEESSRKRLLKVIKVFIQSESQSSLIRALNGQKEEDYSIPEICEEKIEENRVEWHNECSARLLIGNKMFLNYYQGSPNAKIYAGENLVHTGQVIVAEHCPHGSIERLRQIGGDFSDRYIRKIALLS